MSKYAASTEVSSDKSRAEIEGILRRYGATQFAYAWSTGKALIGFEANGRRIRFELPLPDRKAKEFTHTPVQGFRRNEKQADAAYEQEVRRKWRALALAIKAKLEAVASGIATFEEEFLAHIVLPDGQRLGQWFGPQLKTVYDTQKMPPMLCDLRTN